MKVVVLLNSAGGSAARTTPEQLREALTAAGVQAVVEPTRGLRLTDAARTAAKTGVDAVVAAGGDGTINAVAAALVGGETPLGVIPLGTLNHFAGALGVKKLEDAVAVIAAGQVRRIDVAEVNQRIFLNNSSIGLYPRIVRERDKQRETLGRGKWRAMASASLKVFRRPPSMQVRVEAEGTTRVRTVSFVFVGNNVYQMSLLDLGRRAALDAGVLSLYIPTSTGRFAIVRMMLRALVGRLDQSRDFEALVVRETWLDTNRKSVRVAFDGEIAPMIPPLHYQIRPLALKVVAPPAEPPAS